MSRPAALKSDIGTNGLQLGDRDNQASNPELSEDSPYALGKMESVWLSKFRFLESRGYRLRPRYDPDHTHSWLNTSGELDPVVHEDIVRGPKEGEGRVIDATRISDGAQVFLKMIIPGEDEEMSILQWASSESVRSDPRNHCIPLLDEFQESSEGGVHYVVLPLARNWMLPPLRLAVEALSFIRQILEGLAFLHSHGIAHRDIHADNIMMDPSAMFVDGMNPLVNYVDPKDGIQIKEEERRFDRSDVPVKYWWIDFGLSSKFGSYKDRPLVKWKAGRMRICPEIWQTNEDGEQVPLGPQEVDAFGELVPTTLYDPFKADIYVLGSMLGAHFEGMVYLHPLLSLMCHPRPEERPDAEGCIHMFEENTRDLSRFDLLAPVPYAFLEELYRPDTLWTGIEVWGMHRLDHLRLACKAVLFNGGYPL